MNLSKELGYLYLLSAMFWHNKLNTFVIVNKRLYNLLYEVQNNFTGLATLEEKL